MPAFSRFHAGGSNLLNRQLLQRNVLRRRRQEREGGSEDLRQIRFAEGRVEHGCARDARRQVNLT